MKKASRRTSGSTLLTRTALTRKTISNIALAGAIALTCASYGCAKDETPPIIQEWKAPRWVVEGENANFKVDAYDDRKVETVCLQFGDGTTVPLTKIHSGKSNWETSLKLDPGEYEYTIIVKDKNNETKIEREISVWSEPLGLDTLG
jgi:hypothetical protein